MKVLCVFLAAVCLAQGKPFYGGGYYGQQQQPYMMEDCYEPEVVEVYETWEPVPEEDCYEAQVMPYGNMPYQMPYQQPYQPEMVVEEYWVPEYQQMGPMEDCYEPGYDMQQQYMTYEYMPQQWDMDFLQSCIRALKAISTEEAPKEAKEEQSEEVKEEVKEEAKEEAQEPAKEKKAIEEQPRTRVFSA